MIDFQARAKAIMDRMRPPEPKPAPPRHLRYLTLSDDDDVNLCGAPGPIYAFGQYDLVRCEGGKLNILTVGLPRATVANICMDCANVYQALHYYYPGSEKLPLHSGEQ